MAEHGIASYSPDAIPRLQAVDGAYGHSTLTAFCNASLSKIGRLCRVVLSFEVECNPAGRPIFIADAGDLAVHCSLRLLDRQNHRLIWARLSSNLLYPDVSGVVCPFPLRELWPHTVPMIASRKGTPGNTARS